MNRINFHDTHLYPGSTAIFFFTIAANQTTMLALAEFSDGMVADAEVERVASEELIVRIEPYTTASGTSISAKSWRLKYNKTEGLWKVTARI